MYYNYYNDSVNAIAGTVIWTIIALILAIIGGVLVYFLFIKGNLKLNPGLKKLRDVLDFRVMLIEPMLKILYLIGTIFIILFSFSFITVNFLTFILMLLLGPVLIRLAYEASLILVMIWKNTKIISDNTEKVETTKKPKTPKEEKED